MTTRLWRQSKNKLKAGIKNATRRVSGEKEKGNKELELKKDSTIIPLGPTPKSSSSSIPTIVTSTTSGLTPSTTQSTQPKKNKRRHRNKNKKKLNSNPHSSPSSSSPIIIVCASPIQVLDELTTTPTKINLNNIENLLPLDWYSPRPELLDEKKLRLSKYSYLDNEFSWHDINIESQTYAHSSDSQNTILNKDSQLTLTPNDGLSAWGLPKVLIPDEPEYIPTSTCLPSLTHSDDDISETETEIHRAIVRSNTASSGLTLINHKDQTLDERKSSSLSTYEESYDECIDLLITPVNPQMSLIGLRKRLGLVVTIVYFAVLLNKIPSLRQKLNQSLCPAGGYRKKYYHRRNISNHSRPVYLQKYIKPPSPPPTSIFPDWGF